VKGTGRPEQAAVEQAPAAIPGNRNEDQLKRLRSWLVSRTPAKALGSTPQAWQLLVNAKGEVVAATAVEGNDGQGRTALGLPSAEVPGQPAGDTLLVRGVLQPSGFWELSPWHGW
jgi:hypothetical protein